ncbi:uncharacterized protein J3R85_007174 [Psidium guajava]|nr:uncharacterized protein J3R85_007174 [Psidium guajava]
MANQLVSLVIIFCLLLGSRSSVARVLLDDDPSKIGARGSKPHPDGSWSGHSSPSGNVQHSPPTSTINPGEAVARASNANCGRNIRYRCIPSRDTYKRTSP